MEHRFELIRLSGSVELIEPQLSMNIEELRKIRNKNVQQQNELTYLEMKEEADSFRNNPELFPWLIESLSKNSLTVEAGILVSRSSVPEQGGNQWMGTWLTMDKRFYEFDIMANYETGLLIEIESWEEIHPIVSKHCKGTGKSFGYLALKLLVEHENS